MSAWLETLETLVEPEALAELDKEPLEQALGHGLVSPTQVLEAMARRYKLPYLTLERYRHDPAVGDLIDDELARRLRVLALFRIDDRLYVAMDDPDNLMAIDFLTQKTGLEIRPVLALPTDLQGALNRHYLAPERTGQAISRIMAADSKERPFEAAPQQQQFEVGDTPAVQLVQRILGQAIRLRASDVHLEPYEGRCELRYRIDGALHFFPPPPQDMAAAVVSRIKIICNMDIAEKRLPQDGRTRLELDQNHYDLRVSIIPNVYGEGVVVRVLNPAELNLDLTDLGMPADIQERYQRICSLPYGIVLVTGPTGAGKSTTLYSTLKFLQQPEKKIITLENPVELRMDGLTQIEVRPEIGYTFASGLRAVLRHDPDMLMVGEIRDLESAEIAVRAALTGHGLYSTLHTNDSLQAVSRLVDMGLAPYQIQAALNGVLAQRLVRRLCPRCKVPVEVPRAQLVRLGFGHETRTVYGPTGCNHCHDLGYRGRVGLYELLEITPEMRALPRERLRPEVLAELAGGSFRSMADSALEAVFSGVTSFDEIAQVVAGF